MAQDGEKRFFCYANSDLRKEQQNDEILQFVKFWKQRTGELPEELIFDSKLTTYANLNRLNRRGVQFITLRRRGPKLMQELAARPRSAWRRIELEGVSRIYKTPRILDRRVTLTGYHGPIRQIAVAELGQRIGNGYDTAKSRQLFLDFIDATAIILLEERTVVVRLQKRAHNPLLVAAGFDGTDIRIPWLGNRRLEFQFG